ncbi:hypothetical protein [Nonomuraea sp. bgisy101]|uniref:hypothetical protein n=1 Tax=Nonomuraea sp. bgisy101 TaxID=3413784 RepID=UPI003D746074
MPRTCPYRRIRVAPVVVGAAGGEGRIIRTARAAVNANWIADPTTNRTLRLSRSGQATTASTAMGAAPQVAAQARRPRAAKRRASAKQAAIHDRDATGHRRTP